MKLKRLIVTLAAAVMLSGAAIGCTRRKNRHSSSGADWNICIKEQYIE